MRLIRHYDKEKGCMVDGPPPQPKKFGEGPQLMPMFQEYCAVGTDGRIVKTRTDHKNMLKEFGCEELGNEKPDLGRGEQDG